MRESAGGNDEVTIGMIRAAPDEVRREVYSVLVRLWEQADTDEVWEAEVLRAVVIMLYKREGDAQDLNNYRGIFLLGLLSRILARLTGSRLLSYLEDIGYLSEAQWGV